MNQKQEQEHRMNLCTRRAVLGLGPSPFWPSSGHLGGEWFLEEAVCAQSLTCVQLFATPWTVARQAPLSMGFSR